MDEAREHDDELRREVEADGEFDREAFLEELRANLEGRGLSYEVDDSVLDDEETTVTLARACLEAGDVHLAAHAFGEYIRVAKGPGEQASRFLLAGVEFERAEEWMAAFHNYRMGLRLEPIDTEVTYFLHNNLARTGSRLGRHELAERHCRLAIGVDPLRAEAWLNLGVALEGRRLFGEAAKSYITATRARPREARAVAHLGSLVAARRESVAAHLPDIDAIVERLEALVRAHARLEPDDEGE